MKKIGKKCVSIVACTAMAMAVLTGTGIGASADDVTLEVETTWTGEQLDALQSIMDDFTEESGIGVELIAPGEDYENVMKLYVR